MDLLNAQQIQSKSDPSLFSVQHFCLHDGPGTRSIVFFKGCPLRCDWCQNPESWSRKPELAYKETLCIDCKTCVKTCPENAFTAPGVWDKDKCTLCFKCVDTCPSGALTRFGTSHSVEEILEELRPEYTIFNNSGGGVTFSGGEVTLFSEYAAEIAVNLKHENIHVTIETCGQFKLDEDIVNKVSNEIVGSSIKSPVWKLLSTVDLVLYDLKIFDDEEHKEFCGVSNKEIKHNFETLALLAKQQKGPKIWPRLPLIPGKTSSSKNLTNWANFLLKHGITSLTIVPYHNLGGPKRKWIGLEPAPDIPSLSDDELKESIKLLTEAGITCYEPGEECWA